MLVDANVLFSRTLRDWLFLLRNETEGGMFTVYATEDILAETLYRMRRKYPLAPGHLTSRAHDRISATRACLPKVGPGLVKVVGCRGLRC